MRTLVDNQNNGRPVGRTAIVARQLAIYGIDIAAMNFPEEGLLSEDGGGYTFFWKGTSVPDHRIHGVGFSPLRIR